MTTPHDAELERCKRTIDLVEYAKRTGYESRLHDLGPGITCLEHLNRDWIIVAQSPGGDWIYASTADLGPRRPAESVDQNLERLRRAIATATDKGSIVEFVQRRDWTARHGEVPPERVRERLRAFQESGVPLDVQGPLSPPPHRGARHRETAHMHGLPASAGTQAPAHEVNPAPRELVSRRYDRSKPVGGAASDLGRTRRDAGPDRGR